jgi:hypothetical protein
MRVQVVMEVNTIYDYTAARPSVVDSCYAEICAYQIEGLLDYVPKNSYPISQREEISQKYIAYML